MIHIGNVLLRCLNCLGMVENEMRRTQREWGAKQLVACSLNKPRDQPGVFLHPLDVLT